MEYYPAIKRKEALIHATSCTNFENIMSSERSYPHIHSLCKIPFKHSVQNRQIYRDRKYIRGRQKWSLENPNS